MFVSENSNIFNRSSINEQIIETADTLEIVRKYMNGAVCIASPINTGPLNIRPSNSEIYLSRKRCSCTPEHNCKLHENEDRNLIRQQSSSSTIVEKVAEAKSSSTSEAEKESLSAALPIAVEEVNVKSLENYKKWVQKKNEEKKRSENNKLRIKEMEEVERQKRIEEERDNFKRWLANKKRQEEKKKMEQQKKQEGQKEKLQEKERRNLEADLKYQLWLKKKEARQLKKKIAQQFELIKHADDRQRRIEENEKAYENWLKNSTNKPKPLPPGQGLDSLRSSLSVTYINPIPWASNVEQPKPASQ